MKNFNLNKRYLIIISLIVVLLAIVIGVMVFNTKPHNSNLNSISRRKSFSRTTISTMRGPNANSFPAVPLKCESSLSAVALSRDYIFPAMECQSTTSTNINIFACDGTIFASSISSNCYSPNQNTLSKSLVCGGQLGQLVQGNQNLNYSCTLPQINNSVIYSCSGYINNYSSFAINLSMNVSCSPG